MNASALAARRRRFLEQLPPGSLAVFRAAPESIRSNDTEYPYRPDNDLLYLTEFPEPEAIALFDNAAEPAFTLFVRPRDPERETWTGMRHGTEGANEIFAADAAHTIDAFDGIFRKLLDIRSHLHFSFGRDEPFNQRMLEHTRSSHATRSRSGAPPLVLAPAASIVHEMRLRKAPDEIERMRRAAEITTVAHREALEAARPGAYEHEVEAALAFAFRRLGGSGPAYSSIVASGRNATVLHYVQNSRRMADGDLLLIDAAAEFEYYASDVTRTFPVGKRFRPEQRAVYDVVLAAQEAAIKRVGPGVGFDDVHEAAVGVLVDGLLSLGVLAESRAEALEKHTYRPYYMHRTSHWLGMDVHDAGNYRSEGTSRKLEPGMVLTVEPGLYFGAGTTAERLAGIGVRIEDDVLVTEGGAEVLTGAIPKGADELEHLRREVSFR